MFLLLPLDDRPCNLLFVIMLLAMAGSQPCLWERYTPGNDLRSAPPAPRSLADMSPPQRSGPPLISLNALAAGGLVGSRQIDPARLPVSALPSEGLYHFVVPRLEPTSTDQASKEAYEEVRRFLSTDGGQQRVIHVLQGKASRDSLPAGPIQAWEARTEGWIRWIERLQIPKDRLLVTMDDNRHGQLASWLRERYSWLSDHVMDGADEGGMLLAARSIRESHGTAVRVGIIYAYPGNAKRPGRYESLATEELIARQMRWLGVTAVPLKALRPGDPLLLVHNWNINQGDSHRENSPQANPFPFPLAEKLAGYEEHPLYVADISHANGGDPTFAQALHQRWKSGESDLRAYAGWNTAANSLGTVLAVLAIDQSVPNSVSKLKWREEFLTARFLDDVLYQSRIRQEMEQRLRSAKGDPWALTPLQTAQYEDAMTRRLREEAFKEGWIPSPSGWSLALPWQRSFEASITTSDIRRLRMDTAYCR